MGFKQAAVLAPVSFFLGKFSKKRLCLPVRSYNSPGVFFICFNVDHRILWGQLTEDVVADGFQFYTTFFNAPPAIKVLFAAMLSFDAYCSVLIPAGSITRHGGGRDHWSCFQAPQMG